MGSEIEEIDVISPCVVGREERFCQCQARVFGSERGKGTISYRWQVLERFLRWEGGEKDAVSCRQPTGARGEGTGRRTDLRLRARGSDRVPVDEGIYKFGEEIDLSSVLRRFEERRRNES